MYQIIQLYLNWLSTKYSTISHLNSQSSFRMATVSHETKPFITLYTNVLNDSSTKGMEIAVEINLSNLSFFYISTTQNKNDLNNRKCNLQNQFRHDQIIMTSTEWQLNPLKQTEAAIGYPPKNQYELCDMLHINEILIPVKSSHFEKTKINIHWVGE